MLAEVLSRMGSERWQMNSAAVSKCLGLAEAEDVVRVIADDGVDMREVGKYDMFLLPAGRDRKSVV